MMLDEVRQMMSEAAALTEKIRSTALHHASVLDTVGDDPVFEHVVTLANQISRVGASALVFIEGDRAFVKACSNGTFLGDNPRDVSFCNATIQLNAIHLITDSTLDPHFKENPYTLSGDVRYYVGFPVRLDGIAVGALCTFGSEPHGPTAETIGQLNTLAEVTSAILASRLK